jgi:LPS-assembly protein
MPDQSRLAATKCSIKDGKYELQNVVYTPCYECSDSGEVTWTVKAESVIFDPESYAEYKNANFELFGTPVFYTPYLSHLSPRIKRKSGFLVPKFATSSRSGFSLLPRYLWSISESQELILKPIVTSKIGNVGWAYYGVRFPHGEFNADASLTGVKSIDGQVGNNDFENNRIKKIESSGYRGHLFSKMKYDIDDFWRCGFDINLASDWYYLKKFPFFESVDRALESNIKLEGFEGRNYTSIKAVMFQSEYSENIPRVFPVMERAYSTDMLSGTFSLDSCFMNLDFRENRLSQKLMSNAAWEKEMLLPGGHIIAFKGTLAFRALKVSEKEESDYDSLFGVMPQANLSWKWPLVLSSDWMDTIVTPIVGIIAAGNKKKTDAFEEPFCEITDTNFWDGNKSISHYNVDSGERIYYGLKLAGYKYGENFYRFTIGRALELTAPPDRLEATGLKHKNSNIVASTDVFLSDELTFIANCSYSPQSKRFAKVEAGLNYSDKKICFDAMVFKGRQCLYDPFNPALQSISEEQKIQKYKGIMLDVGWQTTSKIKLKSGVIIGNDADSPTERIDRGNFRLIRSSVGIEYKNECATVDFSIERRNQKGGDLKPETVLHLVVHLKNLGI